MKDARAAVAPASVTAQAGAPRSLSQLFWRRLRRNRLAFWSLIGLAIIHLVGLFAPQIQPYDPNRIELGKKLVAPSAEHPFGTDENGRDILSRVIAGSRVSLAVGLAAMLFSLVIGTALGGVAGFRSGFLDTFLMRTTDGMLSIPLFFFMLTALALIGSTLPNIVVVIGLASWMSVARVVRAEVLRTTPMDYVLASRAIGCQESRVLWRHVLPQAMPSIIVAATLGVATAIQFESALSFLGLGVQPPAASWGNMLSNARGYLWTSPLLTVYPGVMIFLTVLLYNWLGDGLRDALDPTGTRAA
ncbi:MAG: ABC transporter permease [Armatimonadetes bacterium]|nr:ABC transporter permease [Armatimonadota bacterium]